MTEKNFRKLNDEESFDKYQVFMDRTVTAAKAVCTHFSVGAKDRNGHELHPCQSCVKIVRHILELWADFFQDEAIAAAKKMTKTKKMQILPLHHAYEIGMAVLLPEAGRAVDGYGAL